MPASDALLNSTAALLLIGLGWHVPGLAARMRRSGLAWCALGAILPLLDPLRFAYSSEDLIAFLTQDPLFSGPLPGLGTVALGTGAALLLGAPAGRCVRWAGWTAAGLGLAVALAALTPGGAPLLAPFSPHRFALPLLPQDHLWLGLGAAAALTLLEAPPVQARPRRGRWVLWGACAWLALCALPGALAAGSLLFASVGDGRREGMADQARDVEVDPVWPGRWLDIAIEGNDYVARARGLAPGDSAPTRVPRWNDQQLLLRLLEDPVVRRVYFEVFRHPVARSDASGSNIRLTVRELADALNGAPGPALHMETDTQGRQRLYQVERLD